MEKWFRVTGQGVNQRPSNCHTLFVPVVRFGTINAFYGTIEYQRKDFL